MNYNLTSLSDRELLIMVLQKQDNHFQQHEALVKKVERIEEKIIEDIELRLRNLENEKNQRKGAYSFWLILLGAATLINTLLSIKGGF